MKCSECGDFIEVDTDYAKYRQCKHNCAGNRIVGYISFSVDTSRTTPEWCPKRENSDE
jgi:hypothetical protein